MLMRRACSTRMLANEPMQCKWLPNPLALNHAKTRATLLLRANVKGDFKCKQIMVHRAQNPIALRGEKPEPHASPLEVEQKSMDGVRNILGLVPQLLHPRSQMLSPWQKPCLQGFVNFG